VESNRKSYSLENVSGKRTCGKILSNIRGEGEVKAILCLLTIGLAIYAGIGLWLPHYKYLVLKDEMNQLAGITTMNNDKLRQKLIEQIESLEIPIKPEKLKIFRTRKGEVLMRASWEHDVYLFGRFVKTYDFNIEVGEGEIR